MANNYCQCTPMQALNSTMKQAHQLIEMLNTEDEEHFHGFRGEYYKKDKQFYMYAEDSMDESELPDVFLVELGKLIAKNKLEYLEFGFAFTCQKMRPGEFGGGNFRITTTGKIIYPVYLWKQEKG